jgi:hypothetical protein
MASKPEQICQAIVRALQDVPGVTGVYRDRSDAFTREESPALLVECIDEDTEDLGGGQGPWLTVGRHDANTLRVAVTVVVRDPNWQQVADAVRCQAHARIAALMKPGVVYPGIAGLRRLRCEWRSASAELPFGYVSQIYAFEYDSRARDIDEPLPEA